MDRRNVLTKTAKGVMELAGKTSLLGRDVKRVLAVVDGKSTAAELKPRLSNSDASKFVDHLSKLKQDGFVREVPAAAAGSSAAAARSTDDDLDFTSTPSESPRSLDFKAKWKAEEEAQRKDEENAGRVAAEEGRRRLHEEARRKAEAEIEAKRKAAEEMRREAEAEARRKIEEETRRKAEEEARHKAAADAKRMAEEEAIRRAEEEAKRQIEEAKRKADVNARRIVEEEEEARRLAEDPRWSAEDEARRSEEKEARAQADDVARIIAQAEAKRKPEPTEANDTEIAARRIAEAEARARADEAAKRIAEEAVRRKAEAEAEAKRKAAAEALRTAEEDTRRKAEDDARRKAAEEAKRNVEEEARRKAEAEAKRKAATEAEARRLAEEDARRKAANEAKRKAEAETKRRTEEEARRRAEEDARRHAEVEARRRAEEEVRRQEEEEAQRIVMEQARRRVEEEVRRQTEADAKRQAEEDARRRVDEETRRKIEEEARRRVEEESRRIAEEDARRRVEEEARRTAEEQAKRSAEEDTRRRVDDEARRRLEELARLRSEAAKPGTDRRKAPSQADDGGLDLGKNSPGASLFAPDTQFEAARDAALRGTPPKESALSAADRAEADEVAQLVNRRREKNELASKAQLRKAESRSIELPGGRAPEQRTPGESVPGSARARESAFGDSSRELRTTTPAPSRQESRELAPADEPAASVAPVPSPTRTRRTRRKMGRAPVAIVLCGLLVAGVGYVVTRDLDVKFYESIASEYFGVPVQIGAADLSLLPVPAMQFKQILIGGPNGAKVDAVRAVPSFLSLLGDDRKFSSIEINGATVSSQTLIGIPGTAAPARAKMSIASIDASGVTIVDPSWTMTNMGVTLQIGGARGVSTVMIRDAGQSMSISLTAGTGGRGKFEFNAQKINPLGATFELTDFEARGTYGANEFMVEKFDGRIFDGVLRGTAKILPRKGAFAISGTLDARSMKLQKLAPGLFESGEANSQGTFTGASVSIDKLLGAPILEMAFTVDRGTVRGFDTSQVIQGARTFGGTTTATGGAGTLQVNSGRVNIPAFRFSVGTVSASAVAAIDANGNLNGQVAAEQRSVAGVMRGSVTMGGALSNPSFTRAQ